VGLLWFEAFHFRLHAGLLTAPNLHAYPGLLQRSAPSFLVAFTIGSAAIWMPCILQMVLVFSGVTAGARKFRGGWFFAGYIATYAVAGLMAASFGEAFGRLHVVGFAQVIGGIAVAVVGLSLLKVLRVPFLQACGSAMAFAMTKGRLHRLGRPTTGVAFALYCAGCCGPLLIPLYVFLATAGSLREHLQELRGRQQSRRHGPAHTWCATRTERPPDKGYRCAPLLGVTCLRPLAAHVQEMSRWIELPELHCGPTAGRRMTAEGGRLGMRLTARPAVDLFSR
jgi:cytochrome c biogenesis protein CcdA